MSGENRTVRPTGAEAEEQEGGSPSRRTLLRGAAGVAGAGLAATAVAGAVAGPALATAASAAPAPAGKDGQTSHGPAVVVHVRDAGTGEMEIFSGTSQVKVRDPQLAAKLVRAVS
jgi:hypothetical protein